EVLEIVPAKRQDVGGVGRRGPRRDRRRPGVGSVVRTLRLDDFRASGVLTGDGDSPGTNVRAVLRERGPSRPRRDRDEMLGELDPERRGTVEAVALPSLLFRRRLDDRMIVPEHD